MRPSLSVTLAVVLLACSSPRPSPEYERAVSLWNELLRADPDAAAEDPRSDEVLDRLGRVPPASADATAATALRARIETERRDRAAERSRRAEVLRRAGTPSAAIPEPAAPPATASAAAREVAREVPTVTVGMKADAFREGWSGCFRSAGDVALNSPGAPARAGELWSMKDDAGCRAAHPSLVGQVVVLADGAVAAVRPASEVRRVEVEQKVELAPLPDGKLGMVVDGKIVPLPPGARVVRTEGGGAPP